MRRFGESLIGAGLFLICTGSTVAQTVPGTTPAASLAGGFASAIAIGDGEIFLSATGESL